MIDGRKQGAGSHSVATGGSAPRWDDLALDFAPDLLAIQARPPQRLPRVLALSVTALVGAMVLWASLAKVDVVAVAPGRLVPVTFTKVVQAAEAGVVTDILVADGDVVRQGQLLMRLDPRLLQADARAQGQDLVLRKLTLSRIEAELNDRPFAPDKAAPALLVAQVNAQFEARKQALADTLAQEGEALNKARADLLASQQVLDKLARTLPSYRQSATAYQELAKDGYVAELSAVDKARDLLEKEQDWRAQTANVQSLQAAIAQSERRLSSLRSQYRSQLENERIDTLGLINKSGQELEKSSVRSGQMAIYAPSAGVVKDVAATTQGAVVAAGSVLMSIVPTEDQLQAEVLLNHDDVGFAAVGQSARLKVAAYPFQKWGMLDGQVRMVGADATDPKAAASVTGATTPPAAGQASSGYRTLIQLASLRLPGAGATNLPMSAGMAVTAEIHQGRRTVLEYLLSPVQKVWQEAARER